MKRRARWDAERRGLALMLLPYLTGVTLLVVLPALVTFVLAFFRYDLIRPPVFTGLGNFRELAGDEIFHIALGNSLLFILLAVPLRLVGALALALLLHPRFRGVGGYRAAVYLPTVVPDVAYALLWLWLFNPLYGPINQFLNSFGGLTPAWLTDPTAARSAVVIMSLFQIGEGFVVALATRQEIPPELYELSEVEGGGSLYILRRVTLPLMAPTLLLLLFRDTILSFQANFVPALILTQGGPAPYATTYLPLFVYRTGFEYLRYGYAAAATLVMLAITALVVYLQYRLVQRWRQGLAV